MAKNTTTIDEDQFRSCDQLICEYLGFLAANVNADYYKSVIKFVLLYRECLNDFGWQKKYESMSRASVDEQKSRAQQQKRILEKDPQQLFQEEMAKLVEKDQMSNQFAIVNNGQYAPEVCNEFVTFYWENLKHIGLSRDDAIDLTRNFCSWLFANGYTCSKLTIINQLNGEHNSNGIGLQDDIDNQRENYERLNAIAQEEEEEEEDGLASGVGDNYSSLFIENPHNSGMVMCDEEIQQQQSLIQRSQRQPHLQQDSQQLCLSNQNDCLLGAVQLNDIDQGVMDEHEVDNDDQQQINFEGGGEPA